MAYQHFKSNIANMPDNPGAEILRYGWRREDILSLGQGEGSDPTPDFIVQAAHQAMQDGKTFYGPVLGQTTLRDEIAAYYKRVFEATIDPQQIFVTGSGTTAMHLALTSILEKDDEVVAITPIWKNLLGAVHLAQAKTIQVPLSLDEQQGWYLDMEALLGAVTDKTKAILVVTPSNPTGWFMSDEEIQQLLNFAREKNIWIVSDEVYNRAVYDQNHAPSFAQYINPDDKVFLINSFSKSWAMTGWRLGWLTGPEYAESIIRDVALYDNMGPTTFNQFGGIMALQKGEEFIQYQMKNWQKNRDLVIKKLKNRPDITIFEPKSTFYAYFKVKNHENCLELAKNMIDSVSLSLAPGCAFGKAYNGWMRLCFAVSEEKLTDALDRLEQFLDAQMSEAA